MRRYHRWLVVMTGTVLFAWAGAGFSYAGEERGPGIGLESRYGADVNEAAAKEQELMKKIPAASETDSLILVVGQGGSEVTLSYHTRDENGIWKEEFTAAGKYGKNGASGDKREGDKKTPLGTYRFTMAFGVKEDPGSILPYHRLTETDYWVDDPESRYYNQLVDTQNTVKDWNSAEHMAAAIPFYNYGLALDYNSDCVPGMGSAIFLHVMNGEADTGTSGCVKISEDYMEMLVKSVDEETRITIVSDISQLEEE